MINPTLFKKSVDSAPLNLDKLGWTAYQPDQKSLSYIRGYIWRNYKVRIKHPLDWIILCMLNDAMGQQQDLCEKE